MASFGAEQQRRPADLRARRAETVRRLAALHDHPETPPLILPSLFRPDRLRSTSVSLRRCPRPEPAPPATRRGIAHRRRGEQAARRVPPRPRRATRRDRGHRRATVAPAACNASQDQSAGAGRDARGRNRSDRLCVVPNGGAPVCATGPSTGGDRNAHGCGDRDRSRSTSLGKGPNAGTRPPPFAPDARPRRRAPHRMAALARCRHRRRPDRRRPRPGDGRPTTLARSPPTSRPTAAGAGPRRRANQFPADAAQIAAAYRAHAGSGRRLRVLPWVRLQRLRLHRPALTAARAEPRRSV